MDALDRLSFPRYQLRQKFFKIFGEAFHIFDPEGKVVLYSKLKALKIREDIRVYSDESMAEELLRITTKSIFDIAGTYEVIDSLDGSRVGALRRKAMKSIVKDEWLILDETGQEIGKIAEDSMMMALLRRGHEGLAMIFPQRFHATIDDQPVAHFQQNFNPFIKKIDLDFTMDQQGLLDRRLGLAAAILLCAIEGRQS